MHLVSNESPIVTYWVVCIGAVTSSETMIKKKCLFFLKLIFSHLNAPLFESTGGCRAGAAAQTPQQKPACPGPCGRCPRRVCPRCVWADLMQPCRRLRSSPPEGRTFLKWVTDQHVWGFWLTATFGKVSYHIIFPLFFFWYSSLELLLINETQ